MGKFAQVALVVAQVVVSILGICFGADTLPNLITAEGTDDLARGHRAMAMLGAMFVGLSILIVPLAIDLFYHPFMDMVSLTATLLAAFAAPFLIYIPLNRRITRLERERAEAAKASAKES
jgi:ABC-type enterochelin transport system permease subunit